MFTKHHNTNGWDSSSRSQQKGGRQAGPEHDPPAGTGRFELSEPRQASPCASSPCLLNCTFVSVVAEDHFEAGFHRRFGACSLDGNLAGIAQCHSALAASLVKELKTLGYPSHWREGDHEEDGTERSWMGWKPKEGTYGELRLFLVFFFFRITHMVSLGFSWFSSIFPYQGQRQGE